MCKHPLDDVSVYGCFFHTKNEKENENGKFQRRRASEYAEPLMCPCDGTGNQASLPTGLSSGLDQLSQKVSIMISILAMMSSAMKILKQSQRK